MQVRSAIMGRNGRVVLFSLLKVYNSSYLILLCNFLQCCGTRSIFTNVWLFHYFPMFKRV